MDEVGQEIRRLRKAKGWTGAELAVYAGMAPSAVSQIETGRRSPNAGSMAKLAKALEVEVRDLFPKASSPQPSLPLDGEPEERGRASSEALSELNEIARGAYATAVERASAAVGPCADKYQDWLDYVERYADRWEAKIGAGDFDMGAFYEFVATVGDLVPVLHALNAEEVKELPEQPDSFGAPGAKTGVALWRLEGLLEPLLEAAAAKFGSSEDSEFLVRLRQKQAELQKAVSGAAVGRAS